MGGQIYVQQQALPQLVQGAQAACVLGLVELVQDIADLRLQLEELLEGAAAERQQWATENNAELHKEQDTYWW